MKYSSQTRTENLAQFWSQAKPFKRDRDGGKPHFYINGKPYKIKSFTTSRRTHFNAVEERTRCALYLISTLPKGEYRYFRGCIRMPGHTPYDWKRLKEMFRQKLYRYCRYHQVEISLDCKLHITMSRRDDKPYSDDIHFDYVLYTSLDWGERRLGRLLRGFLVDAASMTCKEVSERELPGAVSYVYKYFPNGFEHQKFMESHRLPVKRCPIQSTWTVGGFWRLKPKDVEVTEVRNGIEQTRIKRLKSGFEVVKHEYHSRRIGDDYIPVIETPDYYKRRLILESTDFQASTNQPPNQEEISRMQMLDNGIVLIPQLEEIPSLGIGAPTSFYYIRIGYCAELEKLLSDEGGYRLFSVEQVKALREEIE